MKRFFLLLAREKYKWIMLGISLVIGGLGGASIGQLIFTTSYKALWFIGTILFVVWLAYQITVIIILIKNHADIQRPQ